MFWPTMKSSLALAVLCCVAFVSNTALAFAPKHPSEFRQTATTMKTMTLASSKDEVDIGRRNLFLATTAAVAAALLGNAQPAEATYSAYTHREEDWDARKKNDEIEYSNARKLRRQLQEIAPMNSARSQIFCPNGPTAAVSPLMENKCGDLLAMPSIYGRTEDVVGNSIPGFTKEYRKSATSSKNIASDFGLPSYRAISSPKSG